MHGVKVHMAIYIVLYRGKANRHLLKKSSCRILTKPVMYDPWFMTRALIVVPIGGMGAPWGSTRVQKQASKIFPSETTMTTAELFRHSHTSGHALWKLCKLKDPLKKIGYASRITMWTLTPKRVTYFSTDPFDCQAYFCRVLYRSLVGDSPQFPLSYDILIVSLTCWKLHRNYDW